MSKFQWKAIYSIAELISLTNSDMTHRQMINSIKQHGCPLQCNGGGKKTVFFSDLEKYMEGLVESIELIQEKNKQIQDRLDIPDTLAGYMNSFGN